MYSKFVYFWVFACWRSNPVNYRCERYIILFCYVCICWTSVSFHVLSLQVFQSFRILVSVRVFVYIFLSVCLFVFPSVCVSAHDHVTPNPVLYKNKLYNKRITVHTPWYEPGSPFSQWEERKLGSPPISSQCLSIICTVPHGGCTTLEGGAMYLLCEL